MNLKFSVFYTQKPKEHRYKLLFLCCLFFIDDVFSIKIILLKYIQRDDAYGQCELYDAHLWQVNNHHIFSLTFAYIGGNVPLPSSAAWLEKLTDLFRLTI